MHEYDLYNENGVLEVIEASLPYNMLGSFGIEHNLFLRRLVQVDMACLGVSSYQEISDEFARLTDLEAPLVASLVGASMGLVWASCGMWKVTRAHRARIRLGRNTVKECVVCLY